jgi:phosphoglycolate phosphatase
MKYIYFDFDGTLANSFELGMEIAQELAPKYGFNNVDFSKVDYYRGLSSQELIKEFKVPLYKIPILAPVFKYELFKRIDDLKPYENIPEVLKILSEKYFIGILTSNTVENVKHFLKNHNLQEYISEIRSELHIFGKHNSLKRIISRKKIDKKDFVYVGDETRDIEATKKAKITSIAVSWGFNSEEILLKFSPDYIAHQPTDILRFVDKIFSE